ncbi:hypothetical protein TH61_12695 [Rufibacter sp. DG15C]|uniref:hypothetical protein n=1 Tax=Rufibacter sp. DG15C TaxID=1379909 RepID=UPI00078E90B3|nr:hypothetical protein [Rufibacter sp. DG15C]AMM51862.1 hypothetical protein TH61_12695 [Rufibacter sp. DG15C]
MRTAISGNDKAIANGIYQPTPKNQLILQQNAPQDQPPSKPINDQNILKILIPYSAFQKAGNPYIYQTN